MSQFSVSVSRSSASHSSTRRPTEVVVDRACALLRGGQGKIEWRGWIHRSVAAANGSVGIARSMISSWKSARERSGTNARSDCKSPAPTASTPVSRSSTADRDDP
jgi:hypothetical protein